MTFLYGTLTGTALTLFAIYALPRIRRWFILTDEEMGLHCGYIEATHKGIETVIKNQN